MRRDLSLDGFFFTKRRERTAPARVFSASPYNEKLFPAQLPFYLDLCFDSAEIEVEEA